MNQQTANAQTLTLRKVTVARVVPPNQNGAYYYKAGEPNARGEHIKTFEDGVKVNVLEQMKGAYWCTFPGLTNPDGSPMQDRHGGLFKIHVEKNKIMGDPAADKYLNRPKGPAARNLQGGTQPTGVASRLQGVAAGQPQTIGLQATRPSMTAAEELKETEEKLAALRAQVEAEALRAPAEQVIDAEFKRVDDIPAAEEILARVDETAGTETAEEEASRELTPEELELAELERMTNPQ